jgi:serine/threonine protein kinase
MMDRQRSQRDEPEDEDSEAADCALLDEYWEDLQQQSKPDSRQWLIDRDVCDETIAGDLDVLNLLHRAQQTSGPSRIGSEDSTLWALEPFERKPESRASGSDERRERERRRDFDVLGGLVSNEGEIRQSKERDEVPASAPGEKSPDVGAEPPRRIGKYLVIEMLDSGGQAQVFRVHHAELGKDFVLKLAKRPIEQGIKGQAKSPVHDRLIDEGRLLAQYDHHPNLVRVVDLDVHDGRPFVVMDYVPGLTLEQFVDHQRPSPRQAARLVAELARVVGYLHDRGIVHQDIKPRNVLIDALGRPRLIDFGLARRRHAWSDDAADWSGGTAAYMSPEQAQGRADRISPRTDVFGLGGLLYHLLTGQPLYRGLSRLSMLRQALKAEYLPVRQVNRRVPRALERICHNALTHDPERRYRTAIDLERALRGFLARRRIAAAGLIGLAVLAAWLLTPRSQPRSSEPEPAVISPTTAAPLKIVKFESEHLRGDPSQSFGPLGLSSRAILVGDEVGLTARLDAPAYSFLIALNPDGTIQSCNPPEESDPPSRSAKISFGPSVTFGLTDGPGLQAFVVVASRKPLPPFARWNGREGLRQRWGHVAPDDVSGVWDFEDGKIELVSSVSRGDLRRRSERAAPAPFREVCEYLEKLPDVEAIRAIAFPVRSND